MPKAREVAQELRRIADALDSHPETEVVTADLNFWYKTGPQNDIANRYMAMRFMRQHRKEALR